MTDNEWLDSLKLCHKCRRERQAPGRKHCFDCLEKAREYTHRRYNIDNERRYYARRSEIYREKKKSGICVRCNNPATHGMYCYEHFIKVRRWEMNKCEKRRIKRAERGLISVERKEKGLCRWCGEPAIPGMQCCEKHRNILVDSGKKAAQNKYNRPVLIKYST